MELTDGSETSANHNLTPGKYPKEYIQYQLNFIFDHFLKICREGSSLIVCWFSWRHNPLWLYFHSPVAGFSLLVFARFLHHTQRRATVGRTHLDEWSIRRRDIYLTTHNTHNRQTSMPPLGFEPTISAGERPKTYALDRAATGAGSILIRIRM
jgi:hypothetical protein